MNSNSALAIALNNAGLTESADSITRERLANMPLSPDHGEPYDQKTGYILRGFQFVGEQFASAYVRAKKNLVSPSKGKTVTTEMEVEHCRELGRLFNSWRSITGMDIEAERVADFICGITGTVEPKEREIIECANANQITNAQAADVVRARKLAMLGNAQRRNLHSKPTFMGWLADMDKFGISSDDTPVIDALRKSLVQAYENAGKFADQESRLIVESYAKQFDITLPKWADVLPRWTDKSTAELERVQRIQNEEADRRAQESAEAERQMLDQFGEF